jgi:hypothetical protein
MAIAPHHLHAALRHLADLERRDIERQMKLAPSVMAAVNQLGRDLLTQHARSLASQPRSSSDARPADEATITPPTPAVTPEAA